MYGTDGLSEEAIAGTDLPFVAYEDSLFYKLDEMTAKRQVLQDKIREEAAAIQAQKDREAAA